MPCASDEIGISALVAPYPRSVASAEPNQAAKPVRGWPGIEKYYQGVTKHFTRVRSMEIANLSVDILGDAAYAFFTFRFEVGEPYHYPHSLATYSWGSRTLLDLLI